MMYAKSHTRRIGVYTLVLSLAVALLFLGAAHDTAFAKGKPSTTGQANAESKSGGASKGQGNSSSKSKGNSPSKTKGDTPSSSSSSSSGSSSSGSSSSSPPSQGSSNSARAKGRPDISLSVEQTKCVVERIADDFDTKQDIVDQIENFVSDTGSATSNLRFKRRFARAVRNCGERTFSSSRVTSGVIENFRKNLSRL